MSFSCKTFILLLCSYSHISQERDGKNSGTALIQSSKEYEPSISTENKEVQVGYIIQNYWKKEIKNTAISKRWSWCFFSVIYPVWFTYLRQKFPFFLITLYLLVVNSDNSKAKADKYRRNHARKGDLDFSIKI